ncbi:MAG: pantoate--beta-alanine ligase [Bacillota bacterium]|jgi:pantoate--beta-alanine ligase|nr:pantoate--beta-alanine ligase [Bacillota bacterium]MDD3299083.1 pantoate--beta-alanine ligase [Bacillota bacterium]MDD3850301.1 pantoate--beta-alanine ligase [Bacillota bacterium]MDD4707606.1 pantoate--beta-alanine ligase [Bacillota bacterium]
MKLIKTKAELRDMLKEERRRGKGIGLVPTMGYLHEGHLSLVKKARQENETVVVSIFVNPTQFGEGEDYGTYPRDLNQDTDRCEEAGADIVFAPEVEEMYAQKSAAFVDMDRLTDRLCGASRPGHFRGVMTVVSKLFNIVRPDRAYFGQKDAQQVLVIKRMVRDLDFDVQIVEAPIVREADGLAMSSRNAYLNPTERAAALVLSRALCGARQRIEDGERRGDVIGFDIARQISSEPLADLDYVEVVDAKTLEPLREIRGSVLIAVAARIGSTRLIDNIKLEV